MTKVFIADDHALFREGLKQILADTPDIVVSGEASNGHETLSKLRSGRCDVVILDITMPGMHGLDVLKQLKVEQPKLPVLVLSMHSEERYGARVLRAGASGYLTKDSAPDELVAAIRKVTVGQRYVSPSLMERLAFDREAGTEKPYHELLSDREYQVLCLLALGKGVSEIARDLSLSPKTVSTYRARILEKTRTRSNADLARYAIEHGLID